MFVVFFRKIKKNQISTKQTCTLTHRTHEVFETTFRRGGVEVRHVAFSLYLCFFPVSAIYFCTGIVRMCMFFVLLFFTHPPLVGTLSRVIKRQTAGPSTCRLEGGRAFDAVTLVCGLYVIVFDRQAMVVAAFAEQEG